MQASHLNARLAPKKADIVAKMIRGMDVPSAMDLLSKTHKKGARLLEAVLRSAMANAEHNFKQDPNMMIVKTVVVNQSSSYRRGVPMARGRVRPIRKFLCHIALTLGFPETKTPKKAAKTEKSATKEASKPTTSKKIKTSASSPSSK
jgi:large subunit ribosomal protein L22